ncbi:MAG: hypothetical protein ACRC78_12585 [Planktothrix sp.]
MEIRFKGQIIKNINGVKGEIVEIIEQGNRYCPKECICGTNKASRCTLVVLWDNRSAHEQLPANSTLIAPVIDTNSPLYPLFNLVERIKFRANQ